MIDRIAEVIKEEEEDEPITWPGQFRKSVYNSLYYWATNNFSPLFVPNVRNDCVSIIKFLINDTQTSVDDDGCGID